MTDVNKLWSIIKSVLIIIGLFLLYNIPSFFLALEQPVLLWGSGIVIIGLLIWVAIKSGYFNSQGKLLTSYNLKWVLGAFVAGRFLAVIFTSLMGEVSKNDVAIQEMTKNLPIGSLFMLLCLLAPIGEEIIFRGAILNSISPLKENPTKVRQLMGLLVSSLLFSSVHLSSNVMGFLMYASLGALMGLVYLKTKRLECAIAVHFLNNFLPFLFLALNN